MQFHLFIVSLRCWAFWVLFRKSIPIPICSRVFHTASWSCFKVSGLTLRSLIHFELILVHVKDRDLVSVFYMWMSNFPSTICWTGYIFSIICFWLLCQRSVGYRCVGLCVDCLFWSIGLPDSFCANTMMFLLLKLCSIVWCWVLWCLQHWIFCSELLWLFIVYCVYTCISQLLFLFLCRMSL
jgi:hypothetical protein